MEDIRGPHGDPMPAGDISGHPRLRFLASCSLGRRPGNRREPDSGGRRPMLGERKRSQRSEGRAGTHPRALRGQGLEAGSPLTPRNDPARTELKMESLSRTPSLKEKSRLFWLSWAGRSPLLPTGQSLFRNQTLGGSGEGSCGAVVDNLSSRSDACFAEALVVQW